MTTIIIVLIVCVTVVSTIAICKFGINEPNRLFRKYIRCRLYTLEKDIEESKCTDIHQLKGRIKDIIYEFDTYPIF